MAKEKRTIYRLIYFEDKDHWDRMDSNYEDFNDVNKAMEWGKENDNGHGFQIDKIEQEFTEPPIGKRWRKEEYGWEHGEDIRTRVYDGNSDYKIEEEIK